MVISLQPDDQAPDFDALVTGPGFADQTRVRLGDLKGQVVVLYFYPKDDTPGCTKQACALRDGWDRIKSHALVFGVSVDPIRSHQKFIQKHQLPFPLISDGEKSIAEAYGVWVEKSLYGKTYMGTERTTFVVDRSGIIKAILRKVKPDAHLDEVLESLGLTSVTS
jgi:thioredoxin-dependent peroxiredoxin